MNTISMKLNIPNLRHLHALLCVVQLKSVTQAAETVYLSQSAVTQAIKNIEVYLDTVLFERQSKAVFPTSAAYIYAKRIERCFKFILVGIQKALETPVDEHQFVHNLNNHKLVYSLTSIQLRALLAVGYTHNYTYAAKLLATSQPSVHRAIKDLEQLTTITLVEKNRQAIELTEAGDVLFRYFNLAVNELYQSNLDIKALQNDFAGKISIGSMPLSRNKLLPQAIIKFKKRYPNINIDIIDAPYPTLSHALQYGKLDFLLGALRDTALETSLSEIPLFDAKLYIVARSNHRLINQNSLTLQDLLAYPWVLPSPSTPTRQRFDTMLTQQGLASPTGLVESSSQILIRGLLLEGDFLTLTSHQQVQFEIEQGLLCLIDFDIGDTPRSIGITHRTDWQPSSIHQAFFEQLHLHAHTIQ